VTLPAGHVRLYAEDGSATLIAELDEQIPKITDGYGGFEDTQVPKRKALSDWVGSNPYRMTFGLMLDGWASNTSVEPLIAQLERLARDPGGDRPPPILRAEGPLPRSTNVRWHVESLEWGDVSLRRRGDQVRVRQQVTVGLVQHSDDDRIRLLRKPQGRVQKRYLWRKGDKLTKIAYWWLGSSKRWREIAKLNHVSDSRQIKPGTWIKLPYRTSAAKGGKAP
jgi:hypothetical protein